MGFDAEVTGAPPEVSLELPEAVECESQGEAQVQLYGEASDVDEDLLTAHWLLDAELVVVDEVVALPVGEHELSYRAVDQRGASTRATTTVTVADTSAPALSVERSQTVTGCDGDGAVLLAVPRAAEACTPEEVEVRGLVVARDGEPLDPPVEVGVDGDVVLEAGQYTVEWTARDLAGNEATADQLLSCRG